MKICKLDNCTIKHKAFGLCIRHYNKQYYKKYYKTNPEIYNKSYINYKKNQEKLMKTDIETYKTNKAKKYAKTEEYQRNNPEKVLIWKKNSFKKIGKLFNISYSQFQHALTAWSRSVKKRDSYTCVWCYSTKKLEADHIKKKLQFPKIALDINNGRTLCKSCHLKRHTKYWCGEDHKSDESK